MISKETADSFIGGVEVAARDVGMDDPYALGARVFRWLDENRAFFAAMRSREALREFVMSFPAEAEPYLPLAAEPLQALPTIAQHEIRKLLHKAADANPLEVPPGRPEALDTQTKRKICDEIADLHRSGVQLSTAQERIARRYETSTRSVRRAWSQRDKLPCEPTNLAEVFEALSKIGG